MLKRTITGLCYVAVIAGFFCLKAFVDDRLFYVLVFLFCAIGAFECARMMTGRIPHPLVISQMICGVLFVPVYVVSEYLVAGYGWAFAAGYLVVFAAVISLVCLRIAGKVNFYGCLVPVFYPALPLLFMLLSNDLAAYSLPALLIPFISSPLCDTFAYLVGSLIGGKKLCPKLSPKKTWSGAIGGLFGGAAGGLLSYFVAGAPIGGLSEAATIAIFTAVGFVAGVFTEAGDLIESKLKRTAGVKDSGKILPGHGGILDRIDGLLFAQIFVFSVYFFLYFIL